MEGGAFSAFGCAVFDVGLPTLMAQSVKDSCVCNKRLAAFA